MRRPFNENGAAARSRSIIGRVGRGHQFFVHAMSKRMLGMALATTSAMVAAGARRPRLAKRGV
jgi:hypothetical protein